MHDLRATAEQSHLLPVLSILRARSRLCLRLRLRRLQFKHCLLKLGLLKLRLLLRYSRLTLLLSVALVTSIDS